MAIKYIPVFFLIEGENFFHITLFQNVRRSLFRHLKNRGTPFSQPPPNNWLVILHDQKMSGTKREVPPPLCHYKQWGTTIFPTVFSPRPPLLSQMLIPDEWSLIFHVAFQGFISRPVFWTPSSNFGHYHIWEFTIERIGNRHRIFMKNAILDNLSQNPG